MKSGRLELRLPEAMEADVNEWRRRQPDLPNKSEAVRRLIELGLAAAAGKAPPERTKKRGKA